MNITKTPIGFVHADQDVEIKVDTFNFTRYGLLHGKVVSVSRDAITKDKPPEKTNEETQGATTNTSEPKGQELIYAARISLDKPKRRSRTISPCCGTSTEAGGRDRQAFDSPTGMALRTPLIVADLGRCHRRPPVMNDLPVQTEPYPVRYDRRATMQQARNLRGAEPERGKNHNLDTTQKAGMVSVFGYRRRDAMTAVKVRANGSAQNTEALVVEIRGDGGIRTLGTP